MKISHESPICILPFSRVYNDYDYALVHLFDKYPDYLKYFEESIKNRIMYLDNSIFELGEAFDFEGFKKWCSHFCDINESNFYYVVPDVLEDCERTIQNFKDFKFDRGHKIGVAQGKSKELTLKCFDFLTDKCEIIGISFDYSWFNNEKSLEYRMFKRIEFIKYLKDTNRLKNKKIHLLGCYLPQEVAYYADIPEIFSIDTSNPIVHGIKGITYTPEGLNFKESQKLVELIDTQFIPPEVFINILIFKYFAKGNLK